MKRFFKKCPCGGDPTCPGCRGTGKLRDEDAEAEYADYCRDRDKDDRATKSGRYAED